jgi:hypothetical protein
LTGWTLLAESREDLVLQSFGLLVQFGDGVGGHSETSPEKSG